MAPGPYALNDLLRLRDSIAEMLRLFRDITLDSPLPEPQPIRSFRDRILETRRALDETRDHLEQEDNWFRKLAKTTEVAAHKQEFQEEIARIRNADRKILRLLVTVQERMESLADALSSFESELKTLAAYGGTKVRSEVSVAKINQAQRYAVQKAEKLKGALSTLWYAIQDAFDDMKKVRASHVDLRVALDHMEQAEDAHAKRMHEWLELPQT